MSRFVTADKIESVTAHEVINNSTIWLKPAGVNLAEGDITDIGVEIDE